MESKTGHASSPPARRRRFRLGALRFSVAQFLGALILLLVSAPFVEEMPNGKVIEGALLTLVLLSAVPAIGASRRTLVWGIILVIPAVVLRWLHHAMPDRIPFYCVVGAVLIFQLFVTANLLRFILRAQRVTAEVLQAGIATYLMLGVVWALAYVLVNWVVPNSFSCTVGPPSAQTMSGFTGVYFSFVTLSTVGYGDVIPVSPVARMLAMTEAMTGTIFMAVLISRLVALYTSEQTSEQKEKKHE